LQLKHEKSFSAQNLKIKLDLVNGQAYSLFMNSPLVFEYALKFPNGKYYTGRVNSEALPDYWQGDKREAFTFTLAGAHKKKDSLACFSFCVVEKIL
jgi:hypothetical protein